METDQSVSLRDKRCSDDRDVVDDSTIKDNFQLTTDNNKQCDADSLHKELGAQESASNLSLDDFSQVMTDFLLDNETAVNLKSEDEFSERSFQVLESVFQNEVHSTQIVNKSRDRTIEPSSFISIQKKNDNKAGEIQLRRPSNWEHDSVEGAFPEKRRRLYETQLDSAIRNTSSSAEQTALDTEDSEADQHFCKHVIISNLGMSGERKSVAKLNIQAILHNIEFGVSIELLDVSKVKNEDGQRESSLAEVDNIFCMTTLVPVLKRLSDERKSWAKVEIQRMLHEARFVG